MEEEESGVQGHSWLHGESEAFATLDFVFKTTALEFVVNASTVTYFLCFQRHIIL